MDEKLKFAKGDIKAAVKLARENPALKREIELALIEMKRGQAQGKPAEELLADFRKKCFRGTAIDVDRLGSSLPATGKSFEELQGIVRKREDRKKK